jgi:glutamate dehydrogenase
VLHHDLPFLVDSVRTELNRRGYSIHTLQTTVLSVRRGKKGELLEILPKGTQGEGATRVADVPGDRPLRQCRRTERAEQGTGAGAGRSARRGGRFRADEGQGQELRKASTPARSADGEEKAESELPRMAGGNHFTFLGYEEFVVRDERTAVISNTTPAPSRSDQACLRAGLTADDLRIEDYAVSSPAEEHRPCCRSPRPALPSRVHRPAYPDYVSIRQIDADGPSRNAASWASTPPRCTAKACRSSLYPPQGRGNRTPFDFSQGAPGSKELAQVVEVLPRDDLFRPGRCVVQHGDVDRADPGRNEDRVSCARTPCGRFCYCLACVPRDYSTEVRQKIQQVLMDRLKASDCSSGPSSPNRCWPACN